MTTTATIRTVLVAIVASLLAVSCGDAEGAAPDGRVFELDREPPEGIALVDPDRTDVLPAPVLRSLLQDLLTEHSDVSIEAMRIAADGGDVADVVARLTANTDRLTAAIGVVYGPMGAQAFDELWTSHIEFFYDYAAARAVGDAEAIERVKGELGHYEEDFSSFVDVATSGEADFHAVLHVLHSHVDQLLEQADAWVAGEYERAFSLSTEAHRHMDVIAGALATGISVQQSAAFPGEIDTAEATACAALQLDASLLLGALADLDRAIAVGDVDREAAARGEAADLTAETDPLVLAFLDELPRATDEGAQDRAADRAAVRAMIAAQPSCTGLILP